MKTKTSGFTLVEVCVGIMVFAIVSVGVTATVVQSQKVAEENLLKNAAYGAVQSYLEQIRSFSSAQLKASIAAPSTVPLPTVTVTPAISQGSAGAAQVADSLYLNQSNAKQLLINITNLGASNQTMFYMNLNITPTISDLSVSSGEGSGEGSDDGSEEGSGGGNAIPAYLVRLSFTYEVRHLRGTSRLMSGSLSTIMANI